MNSGQDDIVTFRGGTAGATLAKVMAEYGARVLVLEKDREFRGRIRGYAMAPWGTSEARALGIEDLLLESCASELPRIEFYLGRLRIERCHLPSTTRCRASELAFHHPEMQEGLIRTAAESSADVCT